MNNQEIIIPLQKEGMKAASSVLFLIAMMLIGFFYLSSGLYKFLGHYITFFLQSIIVITLLLFLIGFIYTLLQNNKPEDLARLTSEGIWVRYFGFIPWADIAEFDKYKCPGTPLVCIGIRVKDLNKLSKQASFSGKMGLFWSKILGYPSIIIGNTEMDNDQILSFAHRFMENEQN